MIEHEFLSEQLEKSADQEEQGRGAISSIA